MENLGAMACSRYTGFRKITDRDVLELHCIYIFDISGITNYADIDFILLIFNSKNLNEYLSIKFRAVIL